MSEEALAPTSAEALSGAIELGAVTIYVSTDVDLLEGEFAELHFSVDDGSTYRPQRDMFFHGQILSATHNRASVSGPGNFKILKSATSQDIGIYYDQAE